METGHGQHGKEQLGIVSQVAYKNGLLNQMEEGLDYIDQPKNMQDNRGFECEVNRRDSDCRVRG